MAKICVHGNEHLVEKKIRRSLSKRVTISFSTMGVLHEIRDSKILPVRNEFLEAASAANHLVTLALKAGHLKGHMGPGEDMLIPLI